MSESAEKDALVVRLETLVREWESGQIGDHKVGRWAIQDLRYVLATTRVNPPVDGREPKPCPRCGEVCTYDGWDHVHANGLGIGSCVIPPVERDTDGQS